MSKKKVIIIAAAAVLLIAGVLFVLFVSVGGNKKSREIAVEEAENLIKSTFDAAAVSKPLEAISQKYSFKVNSLEYGNEKDIIAECEISSVRVAEVIRNNYSSFLSSDVKKLNGLMYKSALDFKIEFEKKLTELVDTAEGFSETRNIRIYDTEDRGLVVYTDDDLVDTVYGGIITVIDEIGGIESYQTVEDGKTVEKKIESTNVKKGLIQAISPRYDPTVPDTSNALGRWWNGVKKDFVNNFIMYDRWTTIFKGLAVTIELTVLALLIGIIIGFAVAFVRCTHDCRPKNGPLISVLNAVSKVYLTVIRGTPVVVQIMIIYFVIFMPLRVNKFLSAVICFGLNSGAYVAEIVRGGIMSVDAGQSEAGRSLGFSYAATMTYIIFPQAFKAVLPALANEFVVLLKETSIAFYIGLGDLMYAGNAIRAATYSPFMPLVAVALIYLVMVVGLSNLVGRLEKKLRSSDR